MTFPESISTEALANLHAKPIPQLPAVAFDRNHPDELRYLLAMLLANSSYNDFNKEQDAIASVPHLISAAVLLLRLSDAAVTEHLEDTMENASCGCAVLETAYLRGQQMRLHNALRFCFEFTLAEKDDEDPFATGSSDAFLESIGMSRNQFNEFATHLTDDIIDDPEDR